MTQIIPEILEDKVIFHCKITTPKGLPDELKDFELKYSSAGNLPQYVNHRDAAQCRVDTHDFYLPQSGRSVVFVVERRLEGANDSFIDILQGPYVRLN